MIIREGKERKKQGNEGMKRKKGKERKKYAKGRERKREIG